jgi:hypothetical protein
MLHSISWFAFAKFLATATTLYYLAVIGLFFRQEAKQFLTRKKKRLLLVVTASATTGIATAQDGNAGINQANTMIRGMFDAGTQLMYGVGAILALIGAIRTYKEWNAGHQQEAYRAATGWFGSCLFLVVVATVIKSFFSL